MATWYETSGSGRVVPIEVSRETESFVVLPNGRRAAKNAVAGCIFPTWQEARDHLLRGAEFQVRSLELQLNTARGLVGNLKDMKAPEGTS